MQRTITWSGACKDGLADGYGTLTFFLKGERNWEFIGHYERGELNGKATEIDSDGSVYRGEFKHSRREGHGELVEVSGSDFEGEFVDGNPIPPSGTSHCNSDEIRARTAYPRFAMDYGIDAGKVAAHIYIDPTGSVGHVTSIETTNPAFDETVLGMAEALKCTQGRSISMVWPVGFLMEGSVANPNVALAPPAYIKDGRRILVLLEPGGDPPSHVPPFERFARDVSERVAIVLSKVLREERISVAHVLDLNTVGSLPAKIAYYANRVQASNVILVSLARPADPAGTEAQVRLEFYQQVTKDASSSSAPVLEKRYDIRVPLRGVPPAGTEAMALDFYRTLESTDRLTPLKIVCGSDPCQPVSAATH